MYLNVSSDSLEQKRAISQADLIYNRDTGRGGGGLATTTKLVGAKQ